MEPYIIDVEKEGFSPEEFEDIKQNLETLMSIRAGSQPLDRNLGIDYDGVAGYPLNVAQNMLALDIIEKVNIYEPRVEVESVDFVSNVGGQLIPHVHFVRAEG